MKTLSLPSRGTHNLRARENLMGWLLASPWLFGFLIFTAGPMVLSIFLGLTKWDIVTPPQWAGLDNYSKLFGDPLVHKALIVTTIYAVISVPLHLGLGLLLALMLNQDMRGIALWRTVYYLPSVISGVAVSMLWMWVLNRDFGVLNWLLWRLFDIQGPAWLSSEQWALPALIIMSLWGVGGSMIINLAGLQSIPTELYEAAAIDGANSWQQFRAVTIPMMSPVLFFNLIIGLIAALQTFTPAYVITDGGPNNATLFFMLYLYWNAFQWLKMGYASALAWVLFVYILILTLLVLKSSSAWVFYQGEVQNRS
jgi:multiple sugar transport system permease protein